VSRDFTVRTSVAKLSQLEQSLHKRMKKMAADAQKLDQAYQNAEWNDMVSEKARIELNQYIQKLNRALEELSGVALAVGEMRRLAEQYENME